MPEFSIMYHGGVTGEAVVEKEGLYYCVCCLCSPQNGMFQILVKGEQGTVNLGTCIPEAGKLALRTRIAAKRLGRIKGFEMIGKNEENTYWIPLVAGEPISSLEMILHGCLSDKNGEIGLAINHPCLLSDGDVLPDR